jgi:hypothetical protein
MWSRILGVKSSRRGFLQVSGMALGALGFCNSSAGAQNESVSLISDPDDPVASSAPCRWALKEIAEAIGGHGVRVQQFMSLEAAPPNSLRVVASAHNRQPAANLLNSSDLNFSSKSESLALVPFAHAKRNGILACGDERGLMYALLELADRVQNSERPLSALEQRQAITEKPFNSIRSVGRIFCSDIQDKPWFYDREMWPAYFSMLGHATFQPVQPESRSGI